MEVRDRIMILFLFDASLLVHIVINNLINNVIHTKPVWMFWRREERLIPAGNRIPNRPARSELKFLI